MSSSASTSKLLRRARPLAIVDGFRVSSRWATVLTRPVLVAPLLIAVLALVLLLPAIGTGWAADDYVHQAMLRDAPGLTDLRRSPFDLFRFADGDRAAVHSLMEQGVFPWWADPDVRIAFFRPLSSITHALDYALWPSSAQAMHLHSLAWFALLLGVVALLYRKLGNARIPVILAFALFALDDAHAPVVGWIANRNALIAATFALLALLCLDRWYTEGRRLFAWLGPGCFALGLLAGEMALSGAAYLFAYCLHLQRGPLKQRLLSLAPYGAVVVAWKLACLWGGYGTSGSGVYSDPLTEPSAFLQLGFERALVLFLGLVAVPFADLWEVYPLVAPHLRTAVLVVAGVAVTLFVVALSPSWRRDATLRFYCTGTVLSLLPACATFPHDRLLLVPSFGAMAIIATLLHRAWQQRRRFAAALGGCTLVLFHLVLAPVLLPVRAASVGDFDRLLRASDHTLPADASIGQKTLVLLNPALDPLAAYLPMYREATGRPRPARQLWLASGIADVQLRTLDEHRFELVPANGFLASASEVMLRRPGSGLAAGERVTLPGASVSIVDQTADGRPRRVIVEFELALSDPRLLFMRWQGSGYVPFPMPAPGQTVTLGHADIERLLFGGWFDA